MDGYSLSDIQEYVLKKYWEKPINPINKNIYKYNRK